MKTNSHGQVALEHLKIKFSDQEDEMLKALVAQYGTTNWKIIAFYMKGRTSRQCRERWKYYLTRLYNNDIWNEEEDALLLNKIKEYGQNWKKIAKFFPKKTESGVKKRYLSTIKRDPNASDDKSTLNKSSSSRKIIPLPVPISELLEIASRI